MLYHGTSDKNAKNDCLNFKNHLFKINILNITNTFNNKRRQKLPGSLGYGYYTFEDDYELALKFAKKKYSTPRVIEIELATDIDDDSVLDFLNHLKREKFLKFVDYVEYDQLAKKLMNAFNKTHKYISDKQDVYAGIMTELFIQYLKSEYHQVIKVVRKETETFLDPRNNYKYRLGLPNGIEVCIRNPKCIGTMDIY